MSIHRNRSQTSSSTVGTRGRTVVIAFCALIGAALAWVNEPAMMNAVFQWMSASNAKPVATAEAPLPSHHLRADTPKAGKASADAALRTDDTASQDPPFSHRNAPFSILGVTVLGGMLGAYLGFQLLSLFDSLSRKWDKTDAADRIVLVGGVIVGIVIASPFIVFLQTIGIAASFLPWCYVALVIATITISVYILGQIAEMLPFNRARGPMRRTGIKLLDTNVIIDGRIYDVAKNGFLEGQMYLPRFVLEELQHIADHPDALKRQRGKRGLDVLKLMQADFDIDAGSKDHFAGDGTEPVDSRLVKLARAIGADLVTNDHNLNRVASLQNVRVLNINDLALSLRPNVLPSETLTITIVKEGNQVGQGVGYLDDGTMVVVENGRNRLGDTCELTVTQVIQTERGKMIFGEIYDEDTDDAFQRRRAVMHGPRRG